jgi:hypothetical protein
MIDYLSERSGARREPAGKDGFQSLSIEQSLSNQNSVQHEFPDKFDVRKKDLLHMRCGGSLNSTPQYLARYIVRKRISCDRPRPPAAYQGKRRYFEAELDQRLGKEWSNGFWIIPSGKGLIVVHR